MYNIGMLSYTNLPLEGKMLQIFYQAAYGVMFFSLLLLVIFLGASILANAIEWITGEGKDA